MFLTSRRLLPLIQHARQQAGLTPFKSFKTAQSILARHHCPTLKLDPHHTLYNAATAILILTRPTKNREPLNTYTPPTTAAELQHLLTLCPRPKQKYTITPAKQAQLTTARKNSATNRAARQAERQAEHLAAQKAKQAARAARQAEHLAARAARQAERQTAREARAARQAARQAERLAAREARAARQAKRQAVREARTARQAARQTARQTARHAAHQALETHKNQLRAQGYIPLQEAFALFNSIRATLNRPPYKTTIAVITTLTKHNCPRLLATKSKHYYHAPTIIQLARTIIPRTEPRFIHHFNLNPVATLSDLESGEYTTLKQFATTTGIPLTTVQHHERQYDFLALQHPHTGLTLIHTPTAAAHFLNHYNKQQTP